MFNKSKSKDRKKKARISRKRELVKAISLLIVVAAALRILVIFPCRIPDDSMRRGLYSGDFLLTSSFSYKTSEPKPGDIVVFDHPFRDGEKLARRVIAKGGQTVEIVGKMVYVDNQPLADFPDVLHSDYRILPADFSNRDYYPPQKIPSGHIYVLGDNRDESEDSRNFGFIDLQKVQGKGLFVYFSWAPDPNAPRMESPYIIPAIQIAFYNLFHFPSRIRWGRFFASS